jgi:hypothetical protein
MRRSAKAVREGGWASAPGSEGGGGARRAGPSTPLYEASETSAFALWSLILGVMGPCTVGLGGVAGLVLGILGLGQIARSEGRIKGRGLAIAGIVCSAVSLVVLVAGVVVLIRRGRLRLPVFSSARDQARRAKCINNLNRIQTALIMYAGSWKDNYPAADNEADALTLLLEQRYIESGGVFACPSYYETQARGDPTKVRLDSSNCSYAYSMNLSARSPATCAVLGDKSEANHGGEGVHVAYNDGHVNWQQLFPAQKLSTLPASGDPADCIYARDKGLKLETDSWLRFRDGAER